jgi:hypothetical protein
MNAKPAVIRLRTASEVPAQVVAVGTPVMCCVWAEIHPDDYYRYGCPQEICPSCFCEKEHDDSYCIPCGLAIEHYKRT